MPFSFPNIVEKQATALENCAPLLALASILRKNIDGIFEVHSGGQHQSYTIVNQRIVGATSSIKEQHPVYALLRTGQLEKSKIAATVLLAKESREKFWKNYAQSENMSASAAQDMLLQYLLSLHETWLNPRAAISFIPSKNEGFEDTDGVDIYSFILAIVGYFSTNDILAVCPHIKDSSSVFFETDSWVSKNAIRLSPEQKGMLQLLKKHDSLAMIMSASMLGYREIIQMTFAFYLLASIEILSQEETNRSKVIATMDDTVSKLRDKVLAFRKNPKFNTYYEFLGLPAHLSPSELEKSFQDTYAAYARKDLENFLSESQKESLKHFQHFLKEAFSVLINPKTRIAYHLYLISGERGPFLQQYRNAHQSCQKVVKKIEHLMQESNTDMQVFTQLNDLIEAKLDQYFDHEHLIVVACRWFLHHENLPRSIELASNSLRNRPDFIGVRELMLKEMGPDGHMALVKVLSDQIASLNHYELLGIYPNANMEDIRAAYRTASKYFHPDRFFTRPNIGDLASSVFKKMVKASTELKNIKKRQAYDKGLYKDIEGLLMAKMQQTEQSNAPQTTHGQKFLKMALDAAKAGNHSSAIMNLKMGLQIEPKCLVFRQELDKLQANKG